MISASAGFSTSSYAGFGDLVIFETAGSAILIFLDESRNGFPCVWANRLRFDTRARFFIFDMLFFLDMDFLFLNYACSFSLSFSASRGKTGIGIFRLEISTNWERCFVSCWDEIFAELFPPFGVFADLRFTCELFNLFIYVKLI